MPSPVLLTFGELKLLWDSGDCESGEIMAHFSQTMYICKYLFLNSGAGKSFEMDLFGIFI